MATETGSAVEDVPIKESLREELLRGGQVDETVPRSYVVEHAETYGGEVSPKRKSGLVAKGKDWLRRHSLSSEESEPGSRRRSFGGFHMKRLSSNEPVPDISDETKQEAAEAGSVKVHERTRHDEGGTVKDGSSVEEEGKERQTFEGKRDSEDHSIRPPNPVTPGIASSASVQHVEGVLSDDRNLENEMQKLEADFDNDVKTGRNLHKSFKPVDTFGGEKALPGDEVIHGNDENGNLNIVGNEKETSRVVESLNSTGLDPGVVKDAGCNKSSQGDDGILKSYEKKSFGDEQMRNDVKPLERETTGFEKALEKQKEHIHREIGSLRAQKLEELDILQDEKVATEKELGSSLYLDDACPTRQRQTLEDLDAHNYEFYMEHTAGQHMIGLTPAQHNLNLIQQQKLNGEQVEKSHAERDLLNNDVTHLNERKSFLEKSILSKKGELQQLEKNAHKRELHLQQQMKHEHEREKRKMFLNKRIMDETFSAIKANKSEMAKRHAREVSEKEHRIRLHHLVKEEQDEEVSNALKREKLEGMKLTENEIFRRKEFTALEKAYKSQLLNEVNYHKRRLSQEIQKNSGPRHNELSTKSSINASADEQWNELKRLADREKLEDKMVANQLKLESMRAQQLQNAYMIGEAESRLARKLIHDTCSDPGSVSTRAQGLAATAAAAAIQIQKNRSGPFSEIERINSQRAASKNHRKFIFHKHPPAKSSKEEEIKNAKPLDELRSLP